MPVNTVQALRISSGFGSSTERRASVRYACESVSSWRQLGDHLREPSDAFVLDISQGGLRLLVGEECKVGTLVVIKVDHASGRFAQPLVARVTRVMDLGDDTWLLGASFIVKLKPTDIADFLASPVQAEPATASPNRHSSSSKEGADSPSHRGATEPGIPARRSPGERRRSPRRVGATVAVVLTRAGAASSVDGFVVDRSHGGVCVTTDHPFPVGSTLRMQIINGRDVHTSVRITVRSCRLLKKRWLLGCEFAGTPPSDVMLLLR